MRYGIDLGGTKTEIIALDSNGQEVFRKRQPTPRGNYEAIVDNMASLVAAADEATGSKGSVGVGIPGVVSPLTGLVKNANTTELIGFPLDLDLAKRIDRPVKTENDANCFALSEATDGAGEGAKSVFGIIIGTGVGGGIVIGGKIHRGANAVGGEWGHTPLPWANQNEHPGPACWCGRKGCIETFLSGPGMSQFHNAVGAHGPSAEEIVRQAKEGDAAALKSISIYERRLAKALSGIVNILDPEVIVCGGGLSNIERLYENVPKLLQEYVFSDGITTKLVPARYGDSSGVRGAAWLWD
ncbi:ROK family protein [Sneathiella limimaris]|uniref:ROK family protein n=1 Tax=Sneathiella limimaris TaxID=1964213 RepID=UPI00146A3853|nr:ROK family protein [Sneathiella limimaris]